MSDGVHEISLAIGELSGRLAALERQVVSVDARLTRCELRGEISLASQIATATKNLKAELIVGVVLGLLYAALNAIGAPPALP